MKKFLTISFCLCLAILLSSCGSTKQPTDLYPVMLCQSSLGDTSADASEIPRFTYEKEKTYTRDIDKEIKKHFQGAELDLQYQHSVTNPFYLEERDYYINEERNLEFGFSSETGELQRIKAINYQDQSIFQYPYVLSSEESYRAWAETQLLSVWDINLSEYEYSSETHAHTFDENSSSYPVIDGLLINTDTIDTNYPNKEISFYTITYQKYVDGYATKDVLKIIVEPGGHISTMVKWDSGLENPESLEIDEKKLNASIDALVSSMYETSKYTVKSYEIKGQTLQAYNGFPIMVCHLKLNMRGSDDFTQGIVLVVDLSENGSPSEVQTES